MFEHIGRSYLPEYFAQAYRLLKPGGIFLNHGIALQPVKSIEAIPNSLRGISVLTAGELPAWQKMIQTRVLGMGLFMQRYIFPDGERLSTE